MAARSGLVLVPLTLLAIMNPFSSAPALIAAAASDAAVTRPLARQGAVNSFYVIVASMLVGTNVLALFGISLPILRVGGGLFANAPVLLKRLDDIETLVMTRLIAFILLCVGLQSTWAGRSELHKIVV